MSKRHLAKSYGLRGLYFVDNKTLVASTGEKNRTEIQIAVTEKEDKSVLVTKFNAAPKFSFVSFLDNRKKMKLNANEEKNVRVIVNNPKPIKDDKLHFKSVLEKEYFGKEFNDNIHVQIAYNLLDIKKIISLSITDAMFSINNLRRVAKKNNSPDDIIGKFDDAFMNYETASKKWGKTIDNVFNSFKGYNVYLDHALRLGKDLTDSDNKYNYGILQTFLLLRNATVHESQDSLYNFLFKIDRDNETFDVGGNCECAYKSSKLLYTNDLDNFKKDYLNQSKKLLNIISSALHIEDKNELSVDYFNFLLKRPYKDDGINYKKIREGIVFKTINSNEWLKSFTDTFKKTDPEFKYNRNTLNDIRQSLNNCLDYFLYRSLKNNSDFKNEITGKIKEMQRDENIDPELFENEKNKIYEVKASEFARDHSKELKAILYYVCKYKTKKYDQIGNKGLNVKEVSSDINNEGKNASYFSMFMYTLCKFLEVKEINDLLTSLINKFSQIKNLIDILPGRSFDLFRKDLYLLSRYTTKPYNIDSLIEELRIVKELATKKQKLKKINTEKKPSAGQAADKITAALYRDAINLLVDDDNYESMNFDSATNTVSYTPLLSKLVERVDGEIKEKEVRNFISNNIINNRMFYYVCKYCDPKKCKKIINNEIVTKYCLSQMPYAQLKKYSDSLNKIKVNQINVLYENYQNRKLSPEEIKKQDKEKQNYVNELYPYLKEITPKTVFNFKDGLIAAGNSQNDLEKIKYQSLIKLYLTVIYNVTKNIVNINSSYFMAWSCYDKDELLLKNKDNSVFDNSGNNYLLLSKHYIKEEINKYNAKKAMLIELGSPVSKNPALSWKSKENKKYYKDLRKLDEHISDYTKLNDNLISLDRKYDNHQNDMLELFRNKIVHYNLCSVFIDYVNDIKKMNSYFGMYVFGLVNYLLNEYRYKNEETDKILKFQKDNGVYNKDFVKILCMPFAYNYSRYKNLTVEDIFNGMIK